MAINGIKLPPDSKSLHRRCHRFMRIETGKTSELPSVAPMHPLDPLSAAEVETAADIIREHFEFGEDLRVETIDSTSRRRMSCAAVRDGRSGATRGALPRLPARRHGRACGAASIWSSGGCWTSPSCPRRGPWSRSPRSWRSRTPSRPILGSRQPWSVAASWICST